MLAKLAHVISLLEAKRAEIQQVFYIMSYCYSQRSV